MITHHLDVSYINNFINMGYKNFLLSFILSDMLFRNHPHGSFQSEFGRTEKGGLNAPNESGSFWYRWIPKKVHYIPENQSIKLNYKDIRQNIAAVLNRFNRPLLFKNMNAGMRIALLEQMDIPKKYIFIKRDPVFVAQSIINVRRKFYNDPEHWWSIKPPNYEELKDLSFVKQAVRQIYSIEKQILSDLNHFVDKKNVLTLHYEELEDGEDVMRRIKEFIGDVKVKKSFSHLFIKNENRLKIEQDIMNEIHQEVNKLDWNDYSSEA